MKTHPAVLVALFSAAALLPGNAGGATSVEELVENLTITRTPTLEPLEVSVNLDISAEIAPDVSQYWRRNLIGAKTTDNLVQAIREVIADAVRKSGLFARTTLPGAPTTAYHVKIRFEIFDANVFRARLVFQVVDPATGRELSRQMGEVELGVWTPPDKRGISFTSAKFRQGTVTDILTQATRDALQTLLPPLEAAFAERMQELGAPPDQENAIKDLTKLRLPELLASTDPNFEMAKARNRALVAAKVQQLSGILRDGHTDDLVALQVHVEQTILDLDHESTMANDRTQRLIAAAGGNRAIERQRSLAISYRERIELLKPIAAAIKEEIANRNR